MHRNSISSWIHYEKLNKKIPKPLKLDLEKMHSEIPLKLAHFLQGIISINMIQIAQWGCTKALLRQSGRLLKRGKFPIIYGPLKVGNKNISQSNYFF